MINVLTVLMLHGEKPRECLATTTPRWTRELID
jgi:hypothetical protein